MRRVVVTGYGIVSCIGNDRHEVLDSLRAGRSGIRFIEEYRDLGFRSQVGGDIQMDVSERIDRKFLRFMGGGSAYAYVAMQEAIAHAGLTEAEVSNPRTGLIAGSGGISAANVVTTADVCRGRGARKVPPFMVPRTMASTVSACLSTSCQIKGISYTITSACATSLHCIGNAAEQIREGRQDRMFAGGGEEFHWSSSVMFDAMMGALSSRYNDTPAVASRPYDAERDGFVIAGGGGMLVLEELEHAKQRGAEIHGEVVGYGATSDGADMVAPSGEGAARCIHLAVDGLHQPIDYINTHGTSTIAGDITELRAIRQVFGDNVPPLSSTKSLTGHSLGAAGVHEAVYCLLMIKERFIAASANIDRLDPDAVGFPIVRERIDDAAIDTVLTNSFGFGGTNGCLALQRFRE